MRRRSTSATERACSWRAAITTSASRSGRPVDDRSGELGALLAEVEHLAGGVAVAEGELLCCALGQIDVGLQVLVARRHPQRDVVGARLGLAALPLDDPVDHLLGHPPPGGELAAGDRQHPRGGLIELRLAGDVDRLLRVPGRDQGPHPGVGAGQLIGAELELEVVVEGFEQIGDVVTGGRHWSMSPS